MSKGIEEIKEYLKSAYSGARIIGTEEDCLKISRAIAALESDVDEDIFTEEYKERYVLKGTRFEQGYGDK